MDHVGPVTSNGIELQLWPENGRLSMKFRPVRLTTLDYLLLLLMISRSTPARVVLRPDTLFDSVKVFSATLFSDRMQLGERVTAWIADNPQNELTEIIVTQSSDASFHCVALTLFYRAAPRE